MPSIDMTRHSPNYASRNGTVIDCGIVHSCEGMPLDNEEQSSLPWLCNPASRVSCHYYITRSGLIYQLVADSHAAWHAGVSALPGSPERARYIQQRAKNDPIDPVPSVNQRSIGIELEHHAGSAPYPPTQCAAMAWLLIRLCTTYAIPPTRIYTHGDVALPDGRKHDPTDWPSPTFHAWIASLIPPPRYTDASPLLAPCAVNSFSVAVQAMLTRCTPDLLPNEPAFGGYSQDDVCRVIMPVYWSIATRVGLDPVLVWSQVLHETGWLTSFWAQRPRRNPAGIGVTGITSPVEPIGPHWAYNERSGRWHAGLSFATWADDAIPAHLGRLLGFALHPEMMDDAQSALYHQATAVRPLPVAVLGSAPTLKPLGRVHNPSGMGWASPGDTYGAALAALANQLLEAA